MAQFTIEAVVLVIAAAGLGLASAYGLMRLLQGLISEDMMARTPFLRDLSLNGRVLSVEGAIVLAAAILLALPPALQVWSPQVQSGSGRGKPGFGGNGMPGSGRSWW